MPIYMATRVITPFAVLFLCIAELMKAKPIFMIYLSLDKCATLKNIYGLVYECRSYVIRTCLIVNISNKNACTLIAVLFFRLLMSLFFSVKNIYYLYYI